LRIGFAVFLSLICPSLILSLLIIFVVFIFKSLKPLGEGSQKLIGVDMVWDFSQNWVGDAFNALVG